MTASYHHHRHRHHRRRDWSFSGDSSMDLPEECWELICKAIDNDDYRFLEALSLVSTSFLAITNRVRSTFVFTDRSVPFLHRHLLRFRKLKRIRFRDFNKYDLISIIQQVSRSGLDIESVDLSVTPYFPELAVSLMKVMSSVTELNCSGSGDMRDSDLVAIGIYFPFLQKLDISYPDSSPIPITDSGVISLSSTLKGLLKINVSGNNLITDKSLLSLSQNCVLLREILARDCDFISSNCIEFVLRNSQNLESFAIDGIGLSPRDFFSSDAFAFARGLSELDLSNSFPSDELRVIADAKLPLKKLVLSNCRCITFDGIFYLLSKYQSLAHLDLEGSSFLSDEMIMELGMFLRRLTFLNLSFCSKLTGVAFFGIISRCVSLRSMRMEGTNFGVEEHSGEPCIKSGIKSLYISENNNLWDECLGKISWFCPFIETLEVSQCPRVTKDGVLAVLSNCGELRSLDISKCRGIRTLGVDFELPKLKTLRACATLIDDEALNTISERCPGLLHLDLEGCLNVTSRGVKEVVQGCVRLREINIKHLKADDGIFSWMVCVNPSLRKIVPPCGFFPTKRLRKFLLHHGCVICQSL